MPELSFYNISENILKKAYSLTKGIYLRTSILISAFFFSSIIYPSSFDYCPRLLENGVSEKCFERHKELEDYVINRITLDGTAPLSQIVLGSYTTNASFNWEYLGCEHHFVVKYEREKTVSEPNETIFRYFHFNYSGPNMVPTELMYGNYTPIKWDSSNNSKALGDHIEPSYRCEQRLEWEWVTARDILANCPKSFSKPKMASIVFPKKNYPFCDYHIFGIYNVDKDDEASDIEFIHYIYDEKGMNLDFVQRLGFPIRLKGRRIEYPKHKSLLENH